MLHVAVNFISEIFDEISGEFYAIEDTSAFEECIFQLIDVLVNDSVVLTVKAFRIFSFIKDICRHVRAEHVVSEPNYDAIFRSLVRRYLHASWGYSGVHGTSFWQTRADSIVISTWKILREHLQYFGP